MIRILLLLTAVVSAAPSLAAAAPKTGVSAGFGNTILSTYPDGRQGKLWLKEDGSYTAEGRRHDPSSGTWKLKGDQICLRQRKPATVPVNYCTAVPSGGVGSTWSAKSVFGDPLKVKLVAGVK
jgi:hypothetical protein